jgi:hypothetical protein
VVGTGIHAIDAAFRCDGDNGPCERCITRLTMLRADLVAGRGPLRAAHQRAAAAVIAAEKGLDRARARGSAIQAAEHGLEHARMLRDGLAKLLAVLE